jgi:hypothetical protein
MSLARPWCALVVAAFAWIAVPCGAAAQSSATQDPDLRIQSITADRSTIAVGETVVIQVGFVNMWETPGTSTDATLALTLPTNATAMSLCCSRVVTGPSTGTYFFYVQASAPGEMHVRATLAGRNHPDPNLANNAAEVTVIVAPAPDGSFTPVQPGTNPPGTNPPSPTPKSTSSPVARCDVYAVHPGKELSITATNGLLRNDTFTAGEAAKTRLTVTEIAFRKATHPYHVSPDGALRLPTLEGDKQLTLKYVLKSAGKTSKPTTVKVLVQRGPLTAAQRGGCPLDRPPTPDEPAEANASKTDTLGGTAQISFKANDKPQTATLNVAYEAAVNPGSISVTGYANVTSTIAVQRVCIKHTWYVEAGRNTSTVRPIATYWEAQQPGLDYMGMTAAKKYDTYTFTGVDRENSNARSTRVAFTSSHPLAWASGKPLHDVSVKVEMAIATAKRGCGSPLHKKAITVD